MSLIIPSKSTYILIETITKKNKKKVYEIAAMDENELCELILKRFNEFGFHKNGYYIIESIYNTYSSDINKNVKNKDVIYELDSMLDNEFYEFCSHIKVSNIFKPSYLQDFLHNNSNSECIYDIYKVTHSFK